jgi:hypothetical protein
MVFTGPADRRGVVVASQPQQDGVPVEFDVVSANKGGSGLEAHAPPRPVLGIANAIAMSAPFWAIVAGVVWRLA